MSVKVFFIIIGGWGFLDCLVFGGTRGHMADSILSVSGLVKEKSPANVVVSNLGPEVPLLCVFWCCPTNQLIKKTFVI